MISSILLDVDPRADELVAALKARGFTAVAASSAKKDELQKLLRMANALSLLDAYTSSDDAEESKPDPDIIQAALKQAGAKPNQLDAVYGVVPCGAGTTLLD